MNLNTRPKRLLYLALRLHPDTPTTAATLAGELQVTVRTIYRDVSALMQMGLGARGTPRLGYTLNEPPELPPLLLTRAELRALVAGANAVTEQHPEARALLAKAHAIARAK
jgi:predicted DNA-binding transcriptional regulator YafY